MLEDATKLLGEYPALKLGFALAVAGLTLWGMWRADVGRRQEQPDSVAAATQVYLGGPFSEIITILQEIRDLLRKQEERQLLDDELEKRFGEDGRRRESDRWRDMFAIARDIGETLRTRLPGGRRGG